MANITIEVKCVECRQPNKVEMTAAQAGELARPKKRHVQDILPYHRPDIRELFISGICGKCWDRIFSPQEDRR